MLPAQKIADYFLATVEEDEGELVSNLKLQKLLYYAQGFHLAMFDEPLFEDTIKAWNHGPVVPSVYHAYKEYGSNALPRPNNFDPTLYSEKLREFLDEIHNVCGQFSAWKLRRMTHEEPPWQEAFANERGTISYDSMRDFFKNHLLSDK